ncbi:MAG: STAS domain-containing protein [Anaerotignum sp.]
MQITEQRDNDVITISIEGRVDTNTSPQLQDAILKSFQKVNQVVLDFENCVYVSSAGLRALLIGQKTANSKKGTMKLIQVPEILMSVLKVSGFINILTIE